MKTGPTVRLSGRTAPKWKSVTCLRPISGHGVISRHVTALSPISVFFAATRRRSLSKYPSTPGLFPDQTSFKPKAERGNGPASESGVGRSNAQILKSANLTRTNGDTYLSYSQLPIGSARETKPGFFPSREGQDVRFYQADKFTLCGCKHSGQAPEIARNITPSFSDLPLAQSAN